MNEDEASPQPAPLLDCPSEFLAVELKEDEQQQQQRYFLNNLSNNTTTTTTTTTTTHEYIPDRPILGDNGQFECPQCPYISKIERFVHNHIVRVHTPLEQVEWYYCAYCLFKTRTAVGIKVHQAHAHENCTTRVRCIEEYEQYRQEEHQQPQETTQNYVITQFEDTTTTTTTTLPLLSTPTAVPTTTTTPSTTTGTNNEWYKCKLCPYKGKRIHHLTSHIFHMHTPPGEMRWKCEKCPFQCKLKAVFKNHLKNVHHCRT